MSTLVVTEAINGHIPRCTFSTLAAAQALSNQVEVVVLGDTAETAAASVASVENIGRVWYSNRADLSHGIAEAIAPGIQAMVVNEGYSAILFNATTFGKNVAPRLAALLDVSPLTDVMAIDGEKTVVRPIYAGNALQTVESSDAQQVMTIRATGFDAVASGSTPAQAPLALPLADFPERDDVEWIEELTSASDRPELTEARVVISGGRGLGSKEAFGMLEALADKLNAAVGASRAAVDAGYIANDHQVGQTGKVVSPELYVAIGISGAVQHLAGMKDSRCIVAINKDPDAPIFEIADYRLVGDLFEIVPELEKAL